LLVTALVAAALLMAGCGSDEEGAPIPAASAQALQRQLDSIEGRIDNGTVGACRDITGGAQPNTDAVQNIIDSLPKNVDADVKHALQESFDHLFSLTDNQCDELEQKQTPTETNTTPTETETNTTPTETETNTTPTETETTPTQTETAPPSDTTPGNQGNGNGNGGGNGNGNGNGGAGGGAAAPGDEG
jgi:hypothetical protein